MTVAAVGVQIMWDYTKRGLMLDFYEGRVVMVRRGGEEVTIRQTDKEV